MGEHQRSPTLTRITMSSQNPARETVRRQGMTGELDNREGLSRGKRTRPLPFPGPLPSLGFNCIGLRVRESKEDATIQGGAWGSQPEREDQKAGVREGAGAASGP